MAEEIFAGGKERARRQPWKGCRGRGTQPAARAAGAAGREATSREKIRPDDASDRREAKTYHRREAEIRHGIYGVEHLDLVFDSENTRTYGRRDFCGRQGASPEATLERLSRARDAARGPRSGSRGSRSDITRKDPARRRE